MLYDYKKHYIDKIFVDFGVSDSDNESRNIFIKQGNIFILIYSIDNKKSFNEINAIYSDIIKLKGQNGVKGKQIYSCVLVCNKCDLDDKLHEISFEDGMMLADELNIPFIQTSASTNANIDLLFEIAVKRYWLNNEFFN